MGHGSVPLAHGAPRSGAIAASKVAALSGSRSGTLCTSTALQHTAKPPGGPVSQVVVVVLRKRFVALLMPSFAVAQRGTSTNCHDNAPSRPPRLPHLLKLPAAAVEQRWPAARCRGGQQQSAGGPSDRSTAAWPPWLRLGPRPVVSCRAGAKPYAFGSWSSVQRTRHRHRGRWPAGGPGCHGSCCNAWLSRRTCPWGPRSWVRIDTKRLQKATTPSHAQLPPPLTGQAAHTCPSPPGPVSLPFCC